MNRHLPKALSFKRFFFKRKNLGSKRYWLFATSWVSEWVIWILKTTMEIGSHSVNITVLRRETWWFCNKIWWIKEWWYKRCDKSVSHCSYISGAQNLCILYQIFNKYTYINIYRVLVYENRLWFTAI